MSGGSRKRGLGENSSRAVDGAKNPRENCQLFSETEQFDHIDDVTLELRSIACYMGQGKCDAFRNILERLDKSDILSRRDQVPSETEPFDLIDDVTLELRSIVCYMGQGKCDAFRKILERLENSDILNRREEGQEVVDDPKLRFIYKEDITKLRSLADVYVPMVGRAAFEEFLEKMGSEDRLYKKPKNNNQLLSETESFDHIDDVILELRSIECYMGQVKGDAFRNILERLDKSNCLVRKMQVEDAADVPEPQLIFTKDFTELRSLLDEHVTTAGRNMFEEQLEKMESDDRLVRKHSNNRQAIEQPAETATVFTEVVESTTDSQHIDRYLDGSVVMEEPQVVESTTDSQHIDRYLDGSGVMEEPQSAAAIEQIHVTPLAKHEKTWCLSDFTMGRSLGKGKFGDVFKAREKQTLLMVAIKVVNKKFLEQKTSFSFYQLQNEIQIHSSLSHPNIAQLYGSFESADAVHLVLERALFGDLSKYIQGGRTFPPKKFAGFVRQIALALHYCHALRICHRDIKPANILIASEDSVKLCDFGYAKIVDQLNEFTAAARAGSKAYNAPEMLQLQPHNCSVDMWSLGCLIFECLVGKLPFHSANHSLNANYKVPDNIDSGACDLISKLLVIDPNDRISSEEVGQHRWILGGSPETAKCRSLAELDTREVELRKVIEKKFTVTLDDYRSVHKWSCANYSDFWETLLQFSGVKLGTPYEEVIDTSMTIVDFPKWFVGATLNYTENIVGSGDNTNAAFIITTSKTADPATEVTVHRYEDLRNDIQCVATSLRAIGVNMGDHICGFLPNSYETAVVMFATAAVGATWCSASVDFGPNGVLDRFRQVTPKVLFSVEAVTYKGKRFDMREKLNQVVAGLPSLEKIVLINNLNSEIDFNNYEHAAKWEDYDSFKTSLEKVPVPFVYQQVPFAHPLFVMFSSGTTGIPKAIVHTAGGTLLKHIEEHMIQGDARASDRILFYTTCGWMMWNWLMSFLFCGGAIVLYDESPLEPDTHILMKIASNTRSTIIGMGAKLYDEYTKMDIDFKSIYDLRNLRIIYSTGSPLKPAAFEFIAKSIAPGAVIGSISGGTDIIGCFMGCTLPLPVHAGECQCLYLGMDIVAYDNDGKSVTDEQGELVCLTPFPSMPSHFLDDPDFARYKKAYFQRFKGVWAHGDFCKINSKTGGVVMLGRSDATLSRGGVRIGTAEIYSVVETFKEFDDCIVAGQNVPEAEDEHIILFVKMAEEQILNDDLKKRLDVAIRTMMSPRHVPNAVHAVADIPYTNSGKKVEMAVKQIINGEKAEKASSLRNPDSLDLYVIFQLKK